MHRRWLALLARRRRVGAGHGARRIRLGGVWRWLLTRRLDGRSASAAVVAVDDRRDVGAARGARGVSPVVRAARIGCSCCCSRSASPSAGACARLGAWLPARAHGLRHPVVDVEPRAAGVDRAGARRRCGSRPARPTCGRCRCSRPALLLLDRAAVERAGGPRRVGRRARRSPATLWLRETVELLRFIVAIFGRLPIVTPVFVYAALMAAAGLMIVPPLVADDRARRGRSCGPSLVTALCLLAVAVAAGFAYARARLHARAAAAAARARAPGSRRRHGDLGSGVGRTGARSRRRARRGGWTPPVDRRRRRACRGAGFRIRSSFGRPGPALGPAPVDIAAFTAHAGRGRRRAVADGRSRARRAWRSRSSCPTGVTPARSNLPGVPRLGRWTATYVAPPPEGRRLAGQLRAASTPDRLRERPGRRHRLRLPGRRGLAAAARVAAAGTHASGRPTATWVVVPPRRAAD